MIATTLYGLLTLGLTIGGKHVSAYEAYEMASDVVEATPEPLLFPGERMFWMRQTWEEGRWHANPKGYNDSGNACGVTQINRYVIPVGMGTCDELRKSRVKAIAAARAFLSPILIKCGGVRPALGAYMTGGKCGAAPKLTARRCADGAC